MLGFLWGLDKSLFDLIYNLPHNSVFNLFFSFLSGIGTWGLIWFGIMVGLVVWEEIKDRKELFTLVLGLFMAIGLVDLVVKNIVKRPRPVVLHPIPIMFFGHISTYSFPSGHATLAFTAAYILSKKHKRWAKYYYLLAVLIAISRIYLGYHYPSDVVVGALFGLILGYISIRIAELFFPKPAI